MGSARTALLSGCAAAFLLSGCGGGGGGSKPAPTPPPPPPPGSAFDTAEYKASNSAVTSKALSAYDAGATGAGVKVAVIDTGINPNLPEFTGRIDPASADIAANRGIVDHDGHGTMVSGVIAANRDNVYMHGVAFNATILSLNVGDPAGCKPGQDCFLDSSLPTAIDYARMNGARIINMSFGDEEGMTPDIFPAIQRAIDAGIIIVMSSGNDGDPVPNSFAVNNVQTNGSSGLFIIAGAMDANRNMAGFSSRAGTGAPAQSYLTALGVGNATVDEFGNHVNVNGTSFSAPTIAGAAALLAGAFPNLSGSQIVTLLLTTADDAGASGTDTVFGRGILNIQRAFQPQGATKLAGSAQSVSLTGNGSLSGPMGDARSAAGAVILDGYSRAYVLNLAETLQRAAREQPMRQGLSGGTYQSASGKAGPVSMAITVRRDMSGASRFAVEQTDTGLDQGRAAKAVAALAISRLSPRTAIAFGFSQSGRVLQQQLTGYTDNAFLVARDPMARTGFHPQDSRSVAVRHDLGAIAVSLTSERGEVFDPRLRSAFGRQTERSTYGLDAVIVDRTFGAVSLGLGASRLHEEDTILGARFDPFFASGGARTSLVDLNASGRLGSGWSAAASYRHGWTSVGGGGRLVERGRLTSNAFAFDLAKDRVLDEADRLALRIMQPLRVTRGGFDVMLPVGYDHSSATARYDRSFFNLAPTGRELDYELAYGTRLFGGYFDVNAFLRTEPGHIRAARRDIGGALRFTLRP